MDFQKFLLWLFQDLESDTSLPKKQEIKSVEGEMMLNSTYSIEIHHFNSFHLQSYQASSLSGTYHRISRRQMQIWHSLLDLWKSLGRIPQSQNKQRQQHQAVIFPVIPAPKIEDVVEASVPAFDEATYFKYQPDLGLTTPLMFLVKSGDSETIAWFLDELAKRNLLEKALEASTLFGITPLTIAILMDVPWQKIGCQMHC